MKKLPIEVLDNYNKSELKKLKKYIKNYIVPLHYKNNFKKHYLVYN